MCSANNPLVTSAPGTAMSLVPFGLKLAGGIPNTGASPSLNLPPGFPIPNTSGNAVLELHRAQMLDYNARVRLGWQYAAAVGAMPPAPLSIAFTGQAQPPMDPLSYLYGKQDPRAPRYLHEEPKPSHSYIGLIGMAILSSKEGKLVLSDIYQWILDNYPYFRTRGPGWRNSIRHNLSLNDCFIKAGRSANGKGHYWAVHPANVEDFSKGDFRRRRAQRKVRKAMGLAVPDEEDSPSPPPHSSTMRNPLDWQNRLLMTPLSSTARASDLPSPNRPSSPTVRHTTAAASVTPARPSPRRKRLFDVESLLAPEPRSESKPAESSPFLESPTNYEGEKDDAEQNQEVDVVDIDYDDEDDVLRRHDTARSLQLAPSESLKRVGNLSEKQLKCNKPSHTRTRDSMSPQSPDKEAHSPSSAKKVKTIEEENISSSLSPGESRIFLPTPGVTGVSLSRPDNPPSWFHPLPLTSTNRGLIADHPSAFLPLAGARGLPCQGGSLGQFMSARGSTVRPYYSPRTTEADGRGDSPTNISPPPQK